MVTYQPGALILAWLTSTEYVHGVLEMTDSPVLVSVRRALINEVGNSGACTARIYKGVWSSKLSSTLSQSKISKTSMGQECELNQHAARSC